MSIDNISFNVKFTDDHYEFTARYDLTLPVNKRPTYYHLSKKSGLIRGLSIDIKSKKLNDYKIISISQAEITSKNYYSGLYNLHIYSYDENIDITIYEDDGDYSDVYAFAKSLRFCFNLDSDPHAGCYCKTQNVCGCGCDSDHDGW